MDSSPKQTGNTLRQQQSSTFSDDSFGSNNTLIASPTSTSFRRPGYHRIPSVVEEDAVPSADGVLHSGLGISNIDTQKEPTISRVPVGSKASPSTPSSIDTLLSPGSVKKAHHNEDSPHGRSAQQASYHPQAPSPYQPFAADSDHERLHTQNPSTSRNGIMPCRSKKALATGRKSWLSVSILLLSVYSTIFSGFWLFIAIVKPRYNHMIGTRRMTQQTASVLYAAFAKSIELSFVTVFVALVGQILSKRALGERKSITVAEMSMRSWVLQPGTMIAHWESVRYAAVTYLGATALIVAVMAMFYTTASDALVAPRLKFGKAEDRVMYGKVATSFANTYTIMDRCTTPISKKEDAENSGQTCIAIEHSGEAYHNYMQYLAVWSEHIGVGNGSTDMAERPAPVAMLYDNTTVKGTWTEVSNMTALSEQWNRTVNNVTMAMPHSGVVKAATDPRNDIVQPRDLSGLGEYHIHASVPSPVLNVLCANMTENELAPMVYTKWPTFNGTLPNSTSWPNQFDLTLGSPNKTAVDDLFGFSTDQVYPIFPKLPLAYNTVFNFSKSYGPQAVYLLATSPASAYTLCSIRAALGPNCSTEYHASGSGGSLNTNCNADNRLAYGKSDPRAPNGKWNQDWVSVASEWGMALSLNAGITDGSASNARLLTQLIPKSSTLGMSLPSISEALAVLASCTLLQAALDSPFIHYWNYSTTVVTLAVPQYQGFNASVRTVNFQSGGTQRWQNIFIIVLLLVFIVNVCCLAYFLASGDLVTDFVEPQNLFCLSLLSPPSEALEGTCAGGPDREHYNTLWNIKLDKARDHVWFEHNEKYGGTAHKYKQSWSSSTQQTEFEMQGSPMARMYSRIRKKRSSLL